MDEQTSILFLLCSEPQGRTRLKAGIDAVLGFAVFGRQPRVLVSHDAVLALLPRADGSSQRVADLRKLIDSFPLYDLDTIWVDEASLAQRGLDRARLPAFARLVSPKERQALVAAAPAVLMY